MKRPNIGFTLIELVIVIVVIATLAVTAIPRLINLQVDARIAALNGLKRGMQSASDMIYPLAIQQGLAEMSSATITIDNEKIKLVYGYPEANSSEAWSHLISGTFENSQWNPERPADWYFTNNPSENFIRFMTKSRKKADDNCLLIYTEATETTSPTFELITTGC
ncbi:prepilin-type N-terminal cleavage/methylation domain-containing protein [Vibrio renipiscarius]|uniref:MSHA biogenesis protein MshA n=1 Tax=Vibrio renipiscarius TaxID=1461322 RepID=A0A0C2KDV0_9VIBR|nr:prepilin-type N-terminal cleavage/methylation domain-containing protein [Vibrio renipiscarius]KII79295.1 MSHA biogenesis protein MshA [Vibrio renipiscarius]KII80328.1 MSHA biogenesis protein MshA [Vibrio renipiscarius]